MTYELVTTHDSDERKRFNSIALRLEGNISVLAAIITQYDIGVNVCVEIVNASAVASNSVFEGRLGLCISRAITAPIAS